MEEAEARKIAEALVKRLDIKVWAVTISQTKGLKWRVCVHWLNGEQPLAIYNARLLQSPILL